MIQKNSTFKFHACPPDFSKCSNSAPFLFRPGGLREALSIKFLFFVCWVGVGVGGGGVDVWPNPGLGPLPLQSGRRDMQFASVFPRIAQAAKIKFKLFGVDVWPNHGLGPLPLKSGRRDI